MGAVEAGAEVGGGALVGDEDGGAAGEGFAYDRGKRIALRRLLHGVQGIRFGWWICWGPVSATLLGGLGEFLAGELAVERGAGASSGGEPEAGGEQACGGDEGHRHGDAERAGVGGDDAHQPGKGRGSEPRNSQDEAGDAGGGGRRRRSSAKVEGKNADRLRPRRMQVMDSERAELHLARTGMSSTAQSMAQRCMVLSRVSQAAQRRDVSARPVVRATQRTTRAD